MTYRFALLACLALAACAPRSGIDINHVWARATPPGASVAAVYAQVVAHEADEIVAVSSPAAARAEIHTTSETDGIMSMRPVPSVTLPTGIPVKFESGGLHIMLIDLHEPLTAGQSIDVTLTFKNAAPATVSASIHALGEDAHQEHAHHDHAH
jgi:copper(I)-binding protein